MAVKRLLLYCVLGPTWIQISNGISIGSAVFAPLMAESRYTSQWAATPPNIASPMGTTRVLNPNSMSIGSAGFAVLTVQRAYTLQWAALSPLKIAPSGRGIWTSI